MSLYSYYQDLLSSNIGDVTVLHKDGEMKVIKHLILAKCPLLEEDLQEKSPGKYVLDLKQFNPYAVKFLFERIYWHGPLGNVRTIGQLACVYEICKEYDVKVGRRNMYVTDEIIEEIGVRYAHDTFDVLQTFVSLGDTKIFNIYLNKAKEIMRGLLGEHRCFDSIVPGTAERPSNYCSYICCEHSFPVPKPTYLNVSEVRLIHDNNTCCYSLTSGVMKDTSYTDPERYETKFCCKHGKKQKQAMFKKEMDCFSKLPKNIQKMIVSGLVVSKEKKAILGDITDETKSEPEPKPEPKDVPKETPIDDDDFVTILTEEIVNQQATNQS